MTPQSRKLWRIHDKAFRQAKADGACFDCATDAGFAATDTVAGQTRVAKLCPKCTRNTKERTTPSWPC